MTVRRKTMLALVGIALLFGGGTAFAIRGLGQVYSRLEIIYGTGLVGISNLVEADRDGYQSRDALFLAIDLASRDQNADLAPYYASARENVAQVKERFEKYQAAVASSSALREDGSEFERGHQVLRERTESIIALLDAHDVDTARTEFLGAYTAAFNPLRKALDHYTELAQAEAVKSHELSRQTYADVLFYSVACSLIAALIAGIFGFILIRTISTSIRSSMDVAEALSRGDLTVDASSDSGDEFGDLARSFDTMVQALRHVATSMVHTAGALTSGSVELRGASGQIADGAGQQAASIEQVSASIEEINSQIAQTSENAKRTEEIARKVAADAELSNAAVARAVSAMTSISERIGMIEEIAQKTNVLSLNASIEAARAGQHGKGFAVVAFEVGKLAGRSRDAAIDIRKLSNETLGVAREAHGKLSALVTEVARTRDLVHEISASSAEQRLGSDQVAGAVHHLDDVIQRNASAAAELAATAEQFASRASELSETASFFDIGRERPSSGHRRARPSAPPPKRAPVAPPVDVADWMNDDAHDDVGAQVEW